MYPNYSRKKRLVFAIALAVIFTAQKVYVASDTLPVDLRLLLTAGVMPSIFGIIFYWFLGIQRKPWSFSFEKYFSKKNLSSQGDDWAYEQAAAELEEGREDKAVWGRSIAESDGDNSIAKARYIKLRVSRLLSEKVLAKPHPIFDETAESKRSRKIVKNIWLAAGVIGIVAVIFLLITASMENSKKSMVTSSKAWVPPPDAIETPKGKPFDPDEFLRKGATAGSPPAATSSKGGVVVDYDTFTPANSAHSTASKVPAPVNFDDLILKKSTSDPATRAIVGTKDRDGWETIGFTDSAFSDGAKADDRGDYVEAYRLWKPLAEKGDARAQFNIGSMNLKGEGVKQDYPAALMWFKRAANKNYPSATYNLGLMYVNGYGTPIDYKAAIKWFERAAKFDIKEAQYQLGMRYLKGEGVAQSDVVAAKWFHLAADQGDANSQYNYGLMLKLGRGSRQDYVEALKWFELSSKGGVEWAQSHIKSTSSKMTTSQIEDSQKRASEWKAK